MPRLSTEDEAAAANALTAWLRSQDLTAGQSLALLAKYLGYYIAVYSHDEAGLAEGINVAGNDVARSAMQVFAAMKREGTK